MSRKILQVSEFTREARDLLEEHFGTVWLTGEISNLATPASGHIYFSLKDEHAQIRCAMFRNRRSLYRETLENGTEVLLSGNVSIYEARGDFGHDRVAAAAVLVRGADGGLRTRAAFDSGGIIYSYPAGGRIVRRGAV